MNINNFFSRKTESSKDECQQFCDMFVKFDDVIINFYKEREFVKSRNFLFKFFVMNLECWANNFAKSSS